LNKPGLNKPGPGPIEKIIRRRLIQKNNQVVRKRAFYWRYDTAAELELLSQLWLLVSARLNFFTQPKSQLATPLPMAIGSGFMTNRKLHGNE